MPALFSRFFLGISATAAVLSGCSERPQAPAANATTEQSAAPAPLPEEDTNSRDAIKASLPLGTVPATYRAAFEDRQLKRISEERKPQGATALHGTYVFYGARLIEYSGAALQSGANVDLRFDMQGVVMPGPAGTAKPEQSEISAILNRAQLLRSHALARKSSREHAG